MAKQERGPQKEENPLENLTEEELIKKLNELSEEQHKLEKKDGKVSESIEESTFGVGVRSPRRAEIQKEIDRCLGEYKERTGKDYDWGVGDYTRPIPSEENEGK